LSGGAGAGAVSGEDPPIPPEAHPRASGHAYRGEPAGGVGEHGLDDGGRAVGLRAEPHDPMTERVVYINDTFVPESEARVSIYDLGVTQGAAAFEMTRSFNGLHFKLAEHLDRLERSCQTLGIPF